MTVNPAPIWRNPTASDPGARLLVVLAMVSLAFNDLSAILPIGELQSDAFVYVLPVLLVYLFRHPFDVEFPLPFLLLGGIFLVVLAIGFAVNANAVLSAYYKGRSGISRAITQGMVLVLGLLIVLMFHNLARRGFIPAISLGARVALLVMSFFGLLEIGSWLGLPGLSQLHVLLGTPIHGGTGLEYAPRLRMTAFEVSWAAVMLSFFFPFAIIGLRSSWQRLALVALVLVMVMLSQARTGLLVIGAQVLLMTWKTLSRRIDLLIFAGLAAMLAIFVLVLTPSVSEKVAEAAGNMVTYGRISGASADSGPENISNVTRFASSRAGLAMFRDHPLFGVGFGQFGFYYTQYLHAEDYRSWEVRDLYAVDSEPTWPASYSLHARLLAETGIFGYAVFLAMVLPILFNALRHASPDDYMGRVHLAVAMTLFGWLPLGVSIDSLRFYGGWIAVGVGLATYATARQKPRRDGADYPAATSVP